MAVVRCIAGASLEREEKMKPCVNPQLHPRGLSLNTGVIRSEGALKQQVAHASFETNHDAHHEVRRRADTERDMWHGCDADQQRVPITVGSTQVSRIEGGAKRSTHLKK